MSQHVLSKQERGGREYLSYSVVAYVYTECAIECVYRRLVSRWSVCRRCTMECLHCFCSFEYRYF